VNYGMEAEKDAFDTGWFTGLIDGEGFIHIRYRSDRGTMYPRLGIYGTSKTIIDEAARIMEVNAYPRGDHGKQVGWYASVSHRKGLMVRRRVAPYLADSSKKCRAKKIPDTFGQVGTVHGRLGTPEFFRDCPPPTPIRSPRRIISPNLPTLNQRGGEARSSRRAHNPQTGDRVKTRTVVQTVSGKPDA
jgi:hypothetical protein